MAFFAPPDQGHNHLVGWIVGCVVFWRGPRLMSGVIGGLNLRVINLGLKRLLASFTTVSTRSMKHCAVLEIAHFNRFNLPALQWKSIVPAA